MAEFCLISKIRKTSHTRTPTLAVAVLKVMKVFVFIIKPNTKKTC
jgi:hypothetical protein